MRWLALPTLALAAGSAVLMLMLYHPGYDPTRVYEGSDTRACGLLAGAALAMVWPSRRAARAARWTRRVLDGAGVAGLAVSGLMIWRVGQYSSFTYQGGLVVLSVATAGVLAAAACPIRHGALGRVWQRLRTPEAWRARPATLGSWAAATGCVAVVALAGAGLSGAVPVPASGGPTGTLAAGSLLPPPPPKTGSGSGSGGTSGAGTRGAGKHGAGTDPAGSGTATPACPLRTSCQAVEHIGDSTSEGMISPDYLPNPAQRLTAQYHDVGVRTVRTDISGARSVVEVLPGQVNGYDAAQAAYASGFRGCWVIALGTNDTADVAVGSNGGLMTRIGRMMRAAHGEPVMWVNLRSLLATGPYSEANMVTRDNTLLRACARYPNMRVFNWAAYAKTKWYISDGVHFTSAGYAVRGRMIAQALARAFPRTGHSTGCLVS